MTDNFREYWKLKGELIYMRLLHNGYECSEEEALVEALVDAWQPLSDSEKAQIRAQGPQTLLRDDATHEEQRVSGTEQSFPPKTPAIAIR